jgi:hypothetical protein
MIKFIHDWRGRMNEGEEKKNIFVHIPKTGGTTMYEMGIFDESPTHDVFFWNLNKNKYNLFCCKRNPYDRLVSAFFFKKTKQDSRKERKWSKEIKTRPKNSFEEFVNHLYKYRSLMASDYVFYPQKVWIGEVGNFKYIMDFENFNEELKKVMGMIGVEKDVVRENFSLHLDYKEYYNEDLRHKVYEMYREDFELLGYEK